MYMYTRTHALPLENRLTKDVCPNDLIHTIVWVILLLSLP